MGRAPRKTWDDWLMPFGDSVEWVAKKVVRSAELILLTVAVSYAANIANSVIFAIFALILFIIMLMYIAMIFEPIAGYGFTKSKNLPQPWKGLIRALSFALCIGAGATAALSTVDVFVTLVRAGGH